MSERHTFGDNLAAVATGAAQRAGPALNWTHQLIVTTTSGSGAAAGKVQGSNDPAGLIGWQDICTFSATDTVPDSAPGLLHTWLWLRAQCTAISGTGAVAKFASAGV